MPTSREPYVNASGEDIRPQEVPAKRGFAAMGPNERREAARKGGVAGHLKGTAHKFTSDEARVGGQKGGKTTSQNHQHMSEIGRRGGTNRGRLDAIRRAKVKIDTVD